MIFLGEAKIKFTTVKTRKRAVFEPGTEILQKKRGCFREFEEREEYRRAPWSKGRPAWQGMGRGKEGGR
jgi:hypothetical protein